MRLRHHVLFRFFDSATNGLNQIALVVVSARIDGHIVEFAIAIPRRILEHEFGELQLKILCSLPFELNVRFKFTKIGFDWLE